MAEFIKTVGEGKEVQTKGAWVEAKTLKESEVDVLELAAELEDEEVERKMREAVRRQVDEEAKEDSGKDWKESQVAAERLKARP